MTIDEAKLDKILDDKLERLESGLDDKLEKKLQKFEEKLDAKFASFFGQLTKYFDEKFTDFEDRVCARIYKLEETVNGLIVDGLDTDEIERAAMSMQLDRHGRWINVLAKKTNTKLSAP